MWTIAMNNFLFDQPNQLKSALEVLVADPEAKLVAGGMTLLPTMKLRLNEPSRLIDLSKIEDLKGVALDGERITIKAMTRHVDVSSDPIVREHLPALAELAGGIGDVQVRNRGTMGGSTANNDPSADYPAACLGLDAMLQTSQRTLSAAEFFQGLFTTALEPDEILLSISFRIPRRAAYQKFRAVASGYAVVGVFVSEYGDGVRVAVTGAGEDGVYRLTEAEDLLSKNFDPSALEDLQISEDGLMSEGSCLADYRAHLVGVMTRRAVAKAVDR
jgi:aerobic carbon-monoxide dehydrogenase medium subunit